MRIRRCAAAIAALLLAATPAQAGPRETLASAAFATSSRADALAKVAAAQGELQARLDRDPRDRAAALERAVALGYRAQLKRSRSDALAARRAFEALVTSNPRDADAQMALAGWHLASVAELGPLMARTMLGARKSAGMTALDRALALGGDRPLYTGYAALILARIDPGDHQARATRLAEAAVKAEAPTPLDRIMQKSAARILPALRADKPQVAGALAEALLPFGRLKD